MIDEELKKKCDHLEKKCRELAAERDALEKLHTQFRDKVRRMRGHQKEYFKWRASSDLKFARQWEREVDNSIDQEVKTEKSNLNKLF